MSLEGLAEVSFWLGRQMRLQKVQLLRGERCQGSLKGWNGEIILG